VSAAAPRPLIAPVLGVWGLGVLGARDAGAAASAPPDLSLLPRSLRRGLSAGMKLAIDAAGKAVAQARSTGHADVELPIVYGSAVGETQTAVELLTSIIASGESSPVLFRHSVHNAAAGLLSIALQSLASSTAIAAGGETLLAVLLEAVGLLDEGAPAVLLVVSEEGASTLLAPDSGARAGAVACVLAPPGPRDPAGAPDQALAYLTAPERTSSDAPAGDAVAAVDPLAAAWALAAAIAQVHAEGNRSLTPVAVPLSPRQPWRVRVARRPEALT
jgi:hypothetical protein